MALGLANHLTDPEMKVFFEVLKNFDAVVQKAGHDNKDWLTSDKKKDLTADVINFNFHPGLRVPEEKLMPLLNVKVTPSVKVFGLVRIFGAIGANLVSFRTRKK